MVLETHTYPFLLVSWISKIPSRHNIYIKRVLIDSSRTSHSPILCAASEDGGILPPTHGQNSQDGAFFLSFFLTKKKNKPICWVAFCPLFQISVTDPLHAGARWLGKASVKGLRRIFMVNYSFTARYPAVRRVIFGNVHMLGPPPPIFTTTSWQMYSRVPIHLTRGVS